MGPPYPVSSRTTAPTTRNVAADGSEGTDGAAPPQGAQLTPEYRESVIKEVEKRSFLKQGDKGPQVDEFRARLAALGFESKDPPGEFGPDTDKAVRALQTKMDSPEINQGEPFLVDGLVGDQTWGAVLGLYGPDKLPPGTKIVGKNTDEYQGMPVHQPPTQEEIADYHRVFDALANMSTTDAVDPAVARKVADALLAGQPLPEEVSQQALTDLGMRMIEAAREDKPRSDFIYPGSDITDGEFDFLMVNLLGATLAQNDPATQALIEKLTDPGEISIVQQAVATGVYQ